MCEGRKSEDFQVNFWQEHNFFSTSPRFYLRLLKIIPRVQKNPGEGPQQSLNS